jgi:hypothetical protein
LTVRDNDNDGDADVVISEFTDWLREKVFYSKVSDSNTNQNLLTKVTLPTGGTIDIRHV